MLFYLNEQCQKILFIRLLAISEKLIKKCFVQEIAMAIHRYLYLYLNLYFFDGFSQIRIISSNNQKRSQFIVEHLLINFNNEI